MISKNLTKNEENELNSKKFQISKEFDNDKTVKEIKEKQLNTEKAANMFKGLVFFLNREVPKYSLEFIILSFGGQIVDEEDN